MLEQFLFLAAVLPVAIMQGKALFKGDTSSKTVGFMAAACLVGAGVLVTVAQLLTTQKPIILPFETGFQVAFAAISQDTGRVAQGFLFGSGFGNFLVAFTKFKQASFNANQTLWYLPFNTSSSFVLELLATTGIIGLLSFLLVLFRAIIQPAKKKNNPIYITLIILAVAACILPFSFQTIMLFFLALSLFAATQAIKHPNGFFDIEPRFVALKKGFITLEQTNTQTDERHEYSQVMPYTLAILFLIFVATVGLYSTRYVLSNLSFQQALVAATNSNGTVTYKQEVASINMFPYQSTYYRVFSQTNIALANSIATSQPKGASPSAQVQSTVYTLLQQGITTAKNATQIAPQDVANWQNLSSVYRALLGIGQGADTFAVAAAQQAALLDPTNPQEFINLGGLYYQLGQYDNAIRAFQQAVSLKQDFPNAYYNLGHAYLQKQDNQDALQAFQVVAQLTVNDKTNHDKIMAEIQAIQGQSGSSQTPTTTAPTPSQSPAAVQQPLNVSGENPTLPSSPTKIPLEPTATPTPNK
jgi:tetratricopeptide (TPR) repeat protein